MKSTVRRPDRGLLCLASLMTGAIACKPAGKLSSSAVRQEMENDVGAGQGPLGPPQLPPVPQDPSVTSAPAAFKKGSCGEASYYGPGFAGNPTASGEIFDPGKLTAAHRTLPFGTIVRVIPDSKALMPTDPNAGVDVRINDNGPFAPGRIIDLSEAAFARLAPLGTGVLRVCLYIKQ